MVILSNPLLFLSHFLKSERKWLFDFHILIPRVFPNAPVKPVTANMGMKMPSWYDIYSFEKLANSKQDEDGLLKSVHYLHSMITKEVDAGIPANRVVIGGFSQGSCVSLVAGLTSERTLAAVVGLSGPMMLRNKIKSMQTEANKKVRFFLAYGKEDPLVK